MRSLKKDKKAKKEKCKIVVPLTVKVPIIGLLGFFAIWPLYKFLPEGREVLKLIFNASGYAGAATIFGVLYNKTRNEVERPKIIVDSDMSEDMKLELEKGLQKTTAKLALHNFVEICKKEIEGSSKQNDIIKFSDYVHYRFYDREKAFVLQSNELMQQGYERECQNMIKEMEQFSGYSVHGTLFYPFNPIQYPYNDPAAENKIVLEVYYKDDVDKIPPTPLSTVKKVKIFGYALIYAYYNTEMFVSCWKLIERTPEEAERKQFNRR